MWISFVGMPQEPVLAPIFSNYFSWAYFGGKLHTGSSLWQNYPNQKASNKEQFIYQVLRFLASFRGELKTISKICDVVFCGNS